MERGHVNNTQKFFCSLNIFLALIKIFFYLDSPLVILGCSHCRTTRKSTER
uniref:Uncharacterized protein n=1 Tax=Anguilla anguilla TaxID=7936 RepID=A0A0E9QUR8_ANGAN